MQIIYQVLAFVALAIIFWLVIRRGGLGSCCGSHSDDKCKCRTSSYVDGQERQE